jgi:hypothetical protein
MKPGCETIWSRWCDYQQIINAAYPHDDAAAGAKWSDDLDKLEMAITTLPAEILRLISGRNITAAASL